MKSPVPGKAALLAALATSAVVAGCASTNGIRPQDAQADPSALDAGAAIRSADAQAGWPEAEWWRQYQDPQLNQWVADALAGSPSLDAARARVREAESIVGIARSATAPQLAGALSIERDHWPDDDFYGPGPFAGSNTWNNTGTLSLSYHLDLWGKDRNSTERALDDVHASVADSRAAQLELETNTVRTYVDMSMNFALLDIARSTLEQQEQVVSLAEKRLAGGVGTQLELTQARTSIPEEERQIDEFEEDIALDKSRLAALAGKGPGAGDSIARPRLSLSASAGLPSTLPLDLLGHRPDVVAARWTVAAQARGIDVARADFYPDVNLLASLGGYAAGGPAFAFLQSMKGSWTAGPAASLPILDGGRLRAQLGAASAGYDEAVEHYNETIVEALKDVSDTVVRIRSLQAQRTDAERSVALAESSYDLARKGYRRGLTNYLNVLIAQAQLLHVQQTQARVDAESLIAYASLTEALGGGLEAPADSPAEGSTLPSRAAVPGVVGRTLASFKKASGG